jgi:hypothetical protein
MSQLTIAEKEYDAAAERYRKNADFLARVLAGEYASDKMRVEEAAKKAAQKLPRQSAFEPSSGFQPQLTSHPYARSDNSW